MFDGSLIKRLVGGKQYEEADKELGLSAGILEMRSQAVPWAMIIAIVLPLILEYLKSKNPPTT